MAIDLGMLRTVGSELSAVAMAALSTPLRALLPRDGYDPRAAYPTPVILVHGFLGSPTNFVAIRSQLAAAGISNAFHFNYAARLDYRRFVVQLAAMSETLCRKTGVPQIDIVAHSLGGLIARGVIESGTRVRRLVTLGSPSLGPAIAPQELAVYGAADPLIPLPDSTCGPGGRVVIVPHCGHVGLLYEQVVLKTVTTYLAAAAKEFPIVAATRPAA